MEPVGGDSELIPVVGEEALSLETLPADATRSVLELLDAISLAQVRACNKELFAVVDGIAADLLARHMRECRQRAGRRRTFVPRGAEPASFVGSITPGGSINLLGGMCCGGSSRQRSLHGHSIMSSSAWKAASYCGRQALLVCSDGSVVGDGPGMHGAEFLLSCRCDAETDGCDGCLPDADDDYAAGWTAEEEEMISAQEEEAASRGWGWRPREQAAGLGLGATAAPVESKLLALPEAAADVSACPSRSHVLGQSGSVYSARWHGQHACRGPSASPWSCWTPPSPALRVVELSALSAHVLLRTSSGSAMSFGEPSDGKLGYAARIAYVSTPRVVEALLGHIIVGVAAGGRHSLFLTQGGECLTAGANHVGQSGWITAREADRSVRTMQLPDDCARLVQVCAGHAHTLLLSHTGCAYACGLNDHGQCGIEPIDGSGLCVPSPTLISGLLPHTVRAITAAPNLSVFEVEEVATDEVPASEEVRVAEASPSALPRVDRSEPRRGGVADSYRLWLAGHVEAFNIPGTNAHAGGLRFLPSCYRWQLTAAA